MKPSAWLLAAVVVGSSGPNLAAALEPASAAKAAPVPEYGDPAAESVPTASDAAQAPAAPPATEPSSEAPPPSATTPVQRSAAPQAPVEPRQRDSETRSARTGNAPHPIRGLFVRAGLGFGGIGNNVVASAEDADGDYPEATITGMGMSAEISIGGAVSPEWVLGAGLWSSLVFATSYRQIEGEAIADDLRRPEAFTVAGFFGDFYFARELGLHAQGGIGVALLTSTRIDDAEIDGADDSTAGLGPGVTLGVGTDFWIAEHWALGAMARLTAAATIDDEQGVRYVQGVVTPSLLMVACYNE